MLISCSYFFSQVDVERNPQNPATRQHRAETTFENAPASNHSSDNVSSSRKVSKSSEKASDAQVSCALFLLCFPMLPVS